jgi:hypothetical protein
MHGPGLSPRPTESLIAIQLDNFGPIAMLSSGMRGLPKSFPGAGAIWVITPAA